MKYNNLIRDTILLYIPFIGLVWMMIDNPTEEKYGGFIYSFSAIWHACWIFIAIYLYTMNTF